MARILGLDVSPTAVRGALVNTTVRRTEVLRYISAPLQLSPDADPRSRSDALAEAVRSVLGELKRSPDGVVAELDGREGASLRVVELPAGAAKRIGEVLPFELEPLLPFAIEDAIVDYQVIERTSDTLRVLATAAPKGNVARRLEELREAGVDPREFAVGAAALDGLGPVLPGLRTGGPHVIVDVLEDATDLCVLRNGHCELARTLSSGMKAIREGNRGVLESQLRHTLASYRAKSGLELQTAFLAGDAAIHPGATEWLASVAGSEAHVLPLPPAPGADDDGRPLFARAAALAGRVALRGKRLDLRQGEFARRRAMGVLHQNAVLLALCAGIVLASFSFSVYARWAVLSDEQEALREELRQVTEELFDVPTDDPQQARKMLSGNAGPADPLPRFDAFDALDAISGLIPTEVTHDTRRLHIEIDELESKGRLELQGTVDSIAQRDRVASQLEQHDCFQELEKGRTTPGPGNEGLNYQLEAIVKCPESKARNVGDPDQQKHASAKRSRK